MTNSTYGQEINYIELFLEVMSQYTNVFAGIKQQLSLPMTQEEQDFMTQEERNQFANKWLSRAVFNHTQIGAFKHGHKEGRAEGRAEGIAEGREEGESKAKLTMAQNLKSMGMDNEFIMQATGLPVQEIEAL